MWLVGQNQENPNQYTGHVVSRDRMSVAKFLGAFRYKRWGGAPPPPPEEKKKKKRYPWGVLGNQVRNRASGSYML